MYELYCTQAVGYMHFAWVRMDEFMAARGEGDQREETTERDREAQENQIKEQREGT